MILWFFKGKKVNMYISVSMNDLVMAGNKTSSI